jgi:hypothetical protein
LLDRHAQHRAHRDTEAQRRNAIREHFGSVRRHL